MVKKMISRLLVSAMLIVFIAACSQNRNTQVPFRQMPQL